VLSDHINTGTIGAPVGNVIAVRSIARWVVGGDLKLGHRLNPATDRIVVVPSTFGLGGHAPPFRDLLFFTCDLMMQETKDSS